MSIITLPQTIKQITEGADTSLTGTSEGVIGPWFPPLPPEGEGLPGITVAVWKLQVIREAERVKGGDFNCTNRVWLRFCRLCVNGSLICENIHHIVKVSVTVWMRWRLCVCKFGKRLSVTHRSLQTCLFKNDFPHETIYAGKQSTIKCFNALL